MLKHFSHNRLFVTPWTVAHQVPLSVAFPRQEYWSVLPCPSPGDLSDPGIKPTFPVAPALAGKFLTTEPPGKTKKKEAHIKQDYVLIRWQKCCDQGLTET